MPRLARLALLLCLLMPSWAQADSIKQVAITIIIDDLGNNLGNGQRAINLPGPVTYAVLPYRPYSRRLAEQAHQQNKEIMLHMPMDNTHGRALGPGGLTVKQDRSHYEHRLQQAIAATPHISGINNHMGSRLTANSERMQWLMKSLKNYPLYFVDSRTSSNSVAATTASSHHIPFLERDIFLDHDPSVDFIDKQFKKLIKTARREGSAVAIGHPYPSTLGYLENVLPKLDAMGIRLVTPSGLLALRNTPQSQHAPAQSSPLKSTHAPAGKLAHTPELTVENPNTLLVKVPPVATNHCRIVEQRDVTRVSCS